MLEDAPAARARALARSIAAPVRLIGLDYPSGHLDDPVAEVAVAEVDADALVDLLVQQEKLVDGRGGAGQGEGRPARGLSPGLSERLSASEDARTSIH